ncbi:diguanylate cyclase [Shimia sp.]|uniref:diguanylate cyclase n=1 Tax=Shimia sp. TaxID=1954381 RepID=UPI003562BA0B
MPGKILILDNVATNRIVLKVKLSTAFFHVVQAGSLPEAERLLRRAAPDLIVIGTGPDDRACLAACKRLKAAAPGPGIPILLLSGSSSRDLRLEALRAGADHVFSVPVDEAALLARIRSLLRARDAQDDLRLRGRARRALGFAETPQAGFEPMAQIVLATGERAIGRRWRTALKPLLPHAIDHMPLYEALRGLGRVAAPDAFVVALDDTCPDDALRLLAEIRARPSTRGAGILVLLPQSCEALQVNALDLGANDAMTGTFDAEEVALRLETILQRKRLRDRLRRNLEEGLEAAVTDPLTGLFNRRYALPHLKRIAEYSTRGNNDYAVMVADLDHFKTINDRFGHAAGDAVLKEVAERLRNSLRPVDLLARIGGEEFLIVLPATGRAEATRVASRLCRRVGATPVTIQNRDLHIPVTVSIGIALASDHLDAARDGAGDSGTGLLECADRALYGAKATGRNQISLDGPPELPMGQLSRGR